MLDLMPDISGDFSPLHYFTLQNLR